MDPELMRALSQAMRVELLERIAAAPTSARQLAEASGEPLCKVTYHVSVLHDAGCIRPADPTASDPGERVYEITTLMPVKARLALSRSTRGHTLGSVLQRIVDQGVEALEGDTLGDDESHASCETVLLDERGWEEARAIVEEASRRLAEAKAASTKRLGKSGARGRRATIALAAFESPRTPRSRPSSSPPERS